MGKRKTTLQVINEFEKVHGKKYDYSKVEYKNAHSKVNIICKEHGEFQQDPHSHKKGTKCPECSNNLKYDTKRFIKRSKELYPEIFSYSKTKFLDMKSKIIITCKKHGDFIVNPARHIHQNENCISCKKEKFLKKRELAFIKKAIKVHGNTYNYDKTRYVGNKEKIIIVCNKHGEFITTPSSHTNQKAGCPKCGIISRTKKRRKKIDDLLREFRQVHGNKYIYSKVVYLNYHTKIKVVCPKHGDFFITPSSHINQKGGCQKCRKEYLNKHGSYNRLSNEKFIAKAIKIHGNTYDYSKTFYTGMHNPIKVICKIHGEFTQSKAQNHLENEFNCPKCLEIRYIEHTKSTKITYDEAVEKVKNIHRDFIEIHDYSNYKNIDSKITFICNKNTKHGTWEASLHSVTGRGDKGATGCPICKMSHGERKILFWLRDNHIEHKWQYRIKKQNLNKKSFYIYDFYLPKLKMLIEFDGRQHFEAIEAWGGQKSLEKNKKNDKEKTKYAKELKLSMLRISYKNIKKINEILEKNIL
jgi:very-short-patch-repair endonuclease